MGLFPYRLGQAVLDRGLYGYSTLRPSSQQSLSDNRVAAESRASLWGPWIDGGPQQAGWVLPGRQSKHSQYIHFSKK